MRNPHWTRDEEILLLDLYLRVGPKAPSHLAVVELSNLLRSLPIHPPAARTGTFRNPTGVSMKLWNLRHVDPEYAGRGLGPGSRLDAALWAEFAGRTEELSRLAQAIRAVGVELTTDLMPVDGEDEAREGRLLHRLHCTRERSGRLVALKKAAASQAEGRLRCEVCGFDFQATYGSLGKGYAECHHVIPLAEVAAEAQTRLDDLAIVCANCHRMLHRLGCGGIAGLQERIARQARCAGEARALD